MTCGREIRFADRERYSAVQQFATVQTHTLRNRDDNGLFDVRETILLAPQSATKRDRRAAIFDRETTPVFNRSRCYEQLLFINAMKAAPKSLLNTGDKLMKADVTYLLDADPEQMAGEESLTVTRSRASRPRTSRKQKDLPTDDLPTVATAGDDEENCACGESHDNDDEHCHTSPTETDETVVSMKLAERQERAAVPYAERHRVRPHNYTEIEWNELNDAQRMVAWTNEGRVFREQYLALKQKPAEQAARPLTELMLRENERFAKLQSDGFYETEMAKMRAIDECIESEARSKRTLCLDSFSDSQIESMRQLFVEAGMLEIRHDIVCAFCKIVCDPRGQYRRVSVLNIDGMLVNPLTNKPIEERGVVQIWLCLNEYRHIERMLKDKELPLASDVFLLINARRQRARDQVQRNKGAKK